MNWNLISFLTASEKRFKIVLALKNKKKTPTQLSKELGYPLTHISNTLSELKEKKLVKCLTPNRRKNKFHSITKKGRKLLKGIHEKTEVDLKDDF